MMELVAAVSHLLDAARQSASHSSQRSVSALHQLVLIVADGRFHERDALRRIVAVSACLHSSTQYSGRLPTPLHAFALYTPA